MRKSALSALMMTLLLLAGCGRQEKLESEFSAFRESLRAAEHAVCELTLHCDGGDTVADYVLRVEQQQDRCRVTVEQPELIAGITATSRIYSADTNNIGLNLEMDAILAVALGGNSLGGGKFRLSGSIIGAYTIQAITTTLYALGVSSAQAPVFKAIIVILIVKPTGLFGEKTTDKV